MERFTILANDFLNQNVKGFYHAGYRGGGNWKVPGTIENLITTFKNDITRYSTEILMSAANRLRNILQEDLPSILDELDVKQLTVCVVPRAKREDYYRNDQKLFRGVVSSVVDGLDRFENGTTYIIRHTNTKTTHRSKSGHGGDGQMPYPGITKDTCHISPEVYGKDILLIDDLYTRTVNVDEDAIQALLDAGAKSVTFYAIGKTIRRNSFRNILYL